MSLTITVDATGFDQLEERLGDLARKQIGVGIFDDGELSTIAAFHEFGTSKVPERSFIRSTLRDREADIAAFMTNVVERVMAGTLAAAAALELLGMFAANAIKMKITSGSGIAPPLKPATIKAKGSTRALVDTGRLINAINWRIVP